MRALFFGILPFCIFALGARWYWVCQIHQLCDDNVVIEEYINEQEANLGLNSGEETILNGFEHFKFGVGDNEPNLSDNNNQFLDEVATYLKTEEGKNITITGNYLEKEKDIKYGFYENLGQARAAEIRELMIDRGVDEDRFTIDYNMISGEILTSPVTFDSFDDLGETAINSNGEGVDTNAGAEADGNGQLAKMKFTFVDMTYQDANFEFNSDVFKPGEQLKLYADSVKTYLGLNTDKTLTVIGHADSIGGDASNEDLGLRRAKNAAKYFKNLGVTAPITSISMGEKQPVATNDTPEGRQKNRRVNFKIE